MRILIIAEVFLPKVDGVVIRTTNLIRHLLECGDEVLVVCPQAGSSTQSPVPTVEFPSFPFPAYPEYRIGIPDQRLLEAIRDFAPDVLHYINPFAFGFRCHDVVSKSDVSVPSLFSFHTLYGEYVKQYAFLKPLSQVLWWLTRDYHNRADANLTVSTIMQEELTNRGFDRVHLWPPAVDSGLFTPDRRTAEMRNRLSQGHPEQPLLITVSRLAPEKNVGFLADVMKQAPRARLAIIGDGPQRAELENRFHGTSTNFVGYLKGDELAEAYASADAFVYASETETLGNVILEAMASGLCAIAPRAGGIPSLITHGADGLLFSPRNLAEAVDLVQRTIAEPALRAQIGYAARHAVCQRSWRHSADSVRQSYLETIRFHQSTECLTKRQPRLAQLAIAGLVLAFRAMSWRRKPLALEPVPTLHPG